MSAVAFLGVSCTGHDCYPPRNNVEASSDVFVEGGKGIVRVGDAWPIHTCINDPHPSHDGKLAQGSSTVYINGKPAGRIGDMLDCGSAVAEGSSTVFFGG